MSDEHDPNKSELTLSRNGSLAIKRSGLVKRGLELIDEVEKRQVAVPTDHDEKALEGIIEECEIFYRGVGVNMFSSIVAFHKFLHTQVKYMAKMDGVDFEKAKDAYISWAKKCHSAEYDWLKLRVTDDHWQSIFDLD